MEDVLRRIDRVLADLSYAPVIGSTAFTVSGWPWYGDAADWHLGVLESQVLVSSNWQSTAVDTRVAVRTEQARERRAQQSADAKAAGLAKRTAAHAATVADAQRQVALAARRAEPAAVKQVAAARRKAQRAARRVFQQRAHAAQADVQQQVQDAECARVDPLLTEPSLDPSTWKAPRPDLASDIKDAYPVTVSRNTCKTTCHCTCVLCVVCITVPLKLCGGAHRVCPWTCCVMMVRTRMSYLEVG
jgi:hypothetical protein